jgi:hypothetical protein
MVETQFISLLFIIFFINFLGAIFFCKTMFTIIYGTPEERDETYFVETQKKEYGLLNFLVFFILLLI